VEDGGRRRGGGAACGAFGSGSCHPRRVIGEERRPAMARESGKRSGRPGAPRPPAKRTSAKKAYAAPRLVEYGSVAKLTQTGGITVKDGGGMRQMCL